MFPVFETNPVIEIQGHMKQSMGNKCKTFS